MSDTIEKLADIFVAVCLIAAGFLAIYAGSVSCNATRNYYEAENDKATNNVVRDAAGSRIRSVD